MPKVSILMCVYNGEAHLREAVESILGQTFKDFELVIVEDGSTDSTWKILTEYAAQDSRIVLIRNDKNLGLERSLNKGLAKTRGEYFARQDADDISLQNRIELQVKFLDSHLDISALGTSVDFINEEGAFIWRHILPVDHESLKAKLLINNDMHHSTLMARRNILQNIGGYNEKIRYAEDYDLWWRFSCVGHLACLPDILLQRRMDNSPRISNLNRYQQLSSSQSISYRAVQESFQRIFKEQSNAIDEISYKVFWWSLIRKTDKNAYQKFLNSNDIYSRKLQYQDIKKLQPLWMLFHNFPKGSEVLSPYLSRLIYDLLLHRQIIEGIYLAWVMVQQLNISPKAFVEPIMSALKFRLKNLKLEYSNEPST